MDILELLRKQAARFQCPRCGASLADCRLDLMSRSQAESLVKVTCAHCSDTRLIAVSFSVPKDDGPAPPPVLDEPLTAHRPITTDDVLDVRLAFEQHRGDLRSLLG